MDVEKLQTLFSPEVGPKASWGITENGQEDQLSPLHPDETPPGFQTWAKKRQREFRCGRHHARRALAAAGGPAAPILRDEDGVPLFPAGFCGSITHTGRDSTFAAAVIAKENGLVGLDAEVIRDLPDDMVAHILKSSEREALRSVAERPGTGLRTEGTLALLAFSAKEAYYKCVFPQVRHQLGFHDVAFALGHDERVEERGEFTISLATRAYGAPPVLAGRYRITDRHVITAMTWQI